MKDRLNAELAATLKRLKSKYDTLYYLNIKPMFDEHWTGISKVSAAYANVLLQYAPASTLFFTEYNCVKASHVADAVNRMSGLYLYRDFCHGEALDGPLSLDRKGTKIGIFPSVKDIRGVFDFECSVVHDVSTLLVPQYHTLDNVDFHMSVLPLDLSTNDLTACVSEATSFDTQTYFGLSKDSVVVAPNGVHWPLECLVHARNQVRTTAIDPYFLVLGTREPRKNIALVLDMIEQFPEITDSHRFVFTGKIGWMADEQRISPTIGDLLRSGRIIFTGFLSDVEKCKLLMAAEATIYPSFLEGFGLPVLESISLGTPCLASLTSSIPEVGSDLCLYFDPYSVADLHRVIKQSLAAPMRRMDNFDVRCAEHVRSFTWERSLSNILGALEDVIKTSRQNSPPDL